MKISVVANERRMRYPRLKCTWRESAWDQVLPQSDLVNASLLAQTLIDHETARDGQFPQRAGQQLLRLVAEIAPRCQLEIPQHAVVVSERREQSGQGQRRVRAGVERQQQQFQMGARAILRRRGDGGDG